MKTFKLITAGGDINMDGSPSIIDGGGGEKLVTSGGGARPGHQNLSAKIAQAQNAGNIQNYEMFDWRQSNQSLNQESELSRDQTRLD